MLDILLGCKKTGSTFLVGGRNVDGVFKVCSHVRSFTNYMLISDRPLYASWKCLSLFHITSQVLEDFEIPEELRDMFISIPPEEFRMDISSTEIRKKLAK